MNIERLLLLLMSVVEGKHMLRGMSATRGPSAKEVNFACCVSFEILTQNQFVLKAGL
jgi:hypothetical protein